MKSLMSTTIHSSNQLSKTLPLAPPPSTSLHQFYRTSATIDVSNPIRTKINTFTHWNLGDSLPRERAKSHRKNALIRNNTNDMFKFIIEGLVGKGGEEDSKGSAKKKQAKFQQLEGIKTERRERFKRTQNTQFIINYYKQKQGYTPNQEQSIMLDTILFLKQKIDSLYPFDLNIAISYIVKVMNVAVDLNQMKFLILVVMMAGEICYQSKELKSAFFFFQQALVAATCTEEFGVKIKAFIFMGKICIDALEHEKALIFFKKALQYAWKINDGETQLRLYDLMGQCHYYLGNSESAMYYHNRYILGGNAINISAVKRISFEMLAEYEKTLDHTEKQNLTELFLSYLRLPITNFQGHAPLKTQKVYENYIDDASPRKNLKNSKNIFNYNELPDINIQIAKILRQSKQFQTQIPNPDLYRNFVATQKFGKNRKNIDFEQSNDFHKITGIKIKQFDKSILKLPIQEKAAKILQEKSNPHWWEHIVTQVKKQRSQKLGNIRNKTFKRHLSFQESDKRRIQSLKKQKIHQTFNKTILNWIDPPKKGQQ